MSIYLDINEELAYDGEAEQQIWLEYCEMANDEDYDQAPDYYATEDLSPLRPVPVVTVYHDQSAGLWAIRFDGTMVGAIVEETGSIYIYGDRTAAPLDISIDKNEFIPAGDNYVFRRRRRY